MQQNKSNQLKYSTVLAVWKDFGLSQEWQSRSLPAVIVREHGDALAGTTKELIDASVRCETDGGAYTPPPACKWCSLETIDADKYWTYGHRQGWWVCSECKRVYPCRHDDIDNVDELHLTGTCSTCGFRLPCSFIADHLYKKYKDRAERFRVNAELNRKHEQQRHWGDYTADHADVDWMCDHNLDGQKNRIGLLLSDFLGHGDFKGAVKFVGG